MSHPGMAEIYSVGTNPGWGSTPGPGLYGNMGVGGPGLPGIEWAPRGANSALGAALAAMNGGLPPTQHGHIQLKSHDFISQQYLTPPWGDESEKYIMPDMLCFTLGATRSAGSDEAPNCTVVLTLAALNQLLDSQWNELQGYSYGNGGDAESLQFHKYLTTIGEGWLETYHVERERGGERFAYMIEKGKFPDGIDTFYQLARKDFYCWHTRFGILSRVNFCGSVMNVNRGTSLEGYQNVAQSQHFTQVVVGIAKRVRTYNVFGDQEHVDTGSKVWLTLTRKPNGAYCVVPGGSAYDWPTIAQRSYKDASGRDMVGWVWRVGVVATPPTSYSAHSACAKAANLGWHVNEREAYEFSATLPTMYVNMGYSW